MTASGRSSGSGAPSRMNGISSSMTSSCSCCRSCSISTASRSSSSKSPSSSSSSSSRSKSHPHEPPRALSAPGVMPKDDSMPNASSYPPHTRLAPAPPGPQLRRPFSSPPGPAKGSSRLQSEYPYRRSATRAYESASARAQAVVPSVRRRTLWI